MSTSRALRALAVLAVCTLFPASTYAALSKAAGGSGYSGTLSKKPAVRQQQLICDPPEPIRGSTSVLYEADKVSINDFAYGPGYGSIEGTSAMIEVRVGNETRMQDLFLFFNQPMGTETGYLQVFFTLNGQAGQISPDGDILDEDPGPGNPGEGVDTHQFFFDELPRLGAPMPQGVFPTVVATYVIYADEGNRPSGNQRDFLVGLNGNGEEFEFGPDQLQRAVVTAPEPSALALLGVAGLATLRRRRV
jgi:hypothetical protein